MSLAHPEQVDETGSAPRSFHPDPGLSEQLAQMTARALGQVAADSAVQRAQAQIASLEASVEQLRAEAQWREAGWAAERTELLSRVHRAELETTQQRTRLEQAQLDIVELEDEARCTQDALEEAKTAVAAMTERSKASSEQLSRAGAETEQLHAQLLERERLLGAMWQTLRTYRAQGPLQRFLRRPDIPDATPKLIGVQEVSPKASDSIPEATTAAVTEQPANKA
jgi:chromosome segregation ATPase